MSALPRRIHPQAVHTRPTAYWRIGHRGYPTQAPENTLPSFEEAVRAGAEEHSPVELRFAREKLAEANQGMELRQYDKSIYLIEQSEINSELAIEKTRAAIVRAKVAEQVRDNEVLREDFEATYGEVFE